jgi:hypothetical protein
VRPRKALSDERTVSGKNRAAGFLGPLASSFTLAWLASHRGRLRTLLLGGKRLSVLVVWDTKGAALVEHPEADVVAIRQLVHGDCKVDREVSS